MRNLIWDRMRNVHCFVKYRFEPTRCFFSETAFVSFVFVGGCYIIILLVRQYKVKDISISVKGNRKRAHNFNKNKNDSETHRTNRTPTSKRKPKPKSSRQQIRVTSFAIEQGGERGRGEGGSSSTFFMIKVPEASDILWCLLSRLDLATQMYHQLWKKSIFEKSGHLNFLKWTELRKFSIYACRYPGIKSILKKSLKAGVNSFQTRESGLFIWERKGNFRKF